MRSVWYCADCETRIERDDIEDHEDDGHHVRGQLRPDRLLGNDPHNVAVLIDEDDVSGDDGAGASTDATDDHLADATDGDSTDNTETTPTDEPNDDPADEEVTD